MTTDEQSVSAAVGSDIDAEDAAAEADESAEERVVAHRRPLRLVPAAPSPQIIAKLAKKLRSLGASADAAQAIAEVVTQPDHVAVLLDNPRRYRVPGADLLVIHAEAYTARLIADPTNPRVGTLLPFPAAIPPGTAERARFAPVPDARAAGELELEIEVEAIEALIWQLGRAMEETVKQNVPRPSIAHHGVMEPPLAIATRIRNKSDGSTLCRVMVREGSSRLSHAQAILGVSAREALLGHSLTAQKAHIAELNAIANSSASSLAEEDEARVRVATIPIEIVIGVEPDAGTGLTVHDAVAAKVAQDHLNHKKQWDDAAKEVLLGDRVLSTLLVGGELGHDRYAWLAGRLTADEVRASDALPKFSDDRWAQLVYIVATRRRPIAAIVRSAIATVFEQEGVTGTAAQIRNSKLPLAVSLAMRERRGIDTEASVEKFSRVLLNCLPTEAWTKTWAPGSSTVEQLRDRAIMAAAGRVIGPSGIELVVRAAWYLALNGHIAMPRNDLGVGGDRRLPRELLLEMLHSEHGVNQLYRAIVDGRAGSRVAAVTPSGDIDLSGIGEPVSLTDTYIREVVAPRSGPPAPPPRNPQEEFLDALAAYRRALNHAVDADEVLASIDDGYGRSMMSERGLDAETARDIRTVLQSLMTRLNDYEIAKARADARAEAAGAYRAPS